MALPTTPVCHRDVLRVSDHSEPAKVKHLTDKSVVF